MPSLAVAEELLEQVSNEEVRPFSTRDFGREEYHNARSIVSTEEEALPILTTIRQQLPDGMVAFIGTTRNLSGTAPEGVEIVVAPGEDQFQIIQIAESDGLNYGLETKDLVAELRIWDNEFGIDIWQAETDTIQLRLRRTPNDIDAFAKRVYEFCPDVVDQGVGSLPELAKWIAGEQAVYLWWD